MMVQLPRRILYAITCRILNVSLLATRLSERAGMRQYHIDLHDADAILRSMTVEVDRL